MDQDVDLKLERGEVALLLEAIEGRVRVWENTLKEFETGSADGEVMYCETEDEAHEMVMVWEGFLEAVRRRLGNAAHLNLVREERSEGGVHSPLGMMEVFMRRGRHEVYVLPERNDYRLFLTEQEWEQYQEGQQTGRLFALKRELIRYLQTWDGP